MPNLTWHRSSGCASGDCVVVAVDGDLVLVRDSKLGDNSPTLTFTCTEWDAFVEGVRAGEFDVDRLAAGAR